MLLTMTSEGRLICRKAGLIVLVAAVFAGCDQPPTAPPDATPPVVISTSPANSAAGALVNSAITATFSEPMNAASIKTGSVTLKVTSSAAPVGGTVTYDTGSNTARFTPTSALAYGTSYTITVTTAASDVAGNGLASPYSFAFTTIQNVADQPYFRGSDVGDQIHFHITFSQSGNVITLGPACSPLPLASCEIFPENQAGAGAIGPPSPNQNGGSLITALTGTFTDPGITFTFTIANGRTFTFTGTVTNSNMMTGTISGATFPLVGLVLSRENL